LSAVLVPCSNIKYGPGFGISKKAREVDVLDIFREKVLRIAEDLRRPEIRSNRKIGSKIILGDARNLSSIIERNSIDAMITSPPYPGDHEYTKHSRIELIWCEMANNKSEFQMIKKRMLRGSTTNVYREDSLGELVSSISSIRAVTDEIDVRLKADGASSGFEKLYTKLVWEYFGGMYLVFCEARKVLKPSAPFSLLVSDSHAFKMVHIATADLLSEVAKLAGFTSFEQKVWQVKKTTSHGYSLAESILTLR
jgi:DNA modification methylase